MYYEDASDDDEGNVQEIKSKKRCSKCDTAMDSYLIDKERRLHVCGNHPDCLETFLENIVKDT